MVTLWQDSIWGGDNFKSSILLHFNADSTPIQVTGLSHKQLERGDEVCATAAEASWELAAQTFVLKI